jgi:cell division protein FtsL
MLEFIKENQEIMTLLFACVVAISTVFYVILTRQLVSERKKMRKAQTQPEISASLVQNDKTSIEFIDLVIENIGLGPAYNIKFEVLNDFKLSKIMLSEVGFIKNGISYFSPKQPMKLWVDSFLHDKELADKSIELKITYSNSLSDQFNQKFILNFSQFASFTQLGTPPLIKIAEHLNSIEKNIESIASGFKKLKIDIYDSKDSEEEKELTLRAFDEFEKSKE